MLSRQMDVDRQMLITAERDGYFGLRAKPALGSSVSICGLNCHCRSVVNGYMGSFFCGEFKCCFESVQRGANSTSDPIPNFAGNGMFDQAGSSPMRNCQRPLSENIFPPGGEQNMPSGIGK